MYTVKYNFLDDDVEEKQKKKAKQRLKNLENQKKYRLQNLEKIKAYTKKRNDMNRQERKKGDKKRWAELGEKEPRIRQIDLRHFQNSANNNMGELMCDTQGWYYTIKFNDGREYYKSEYFKTKVRAIKDLRLAL